MAQFYIDIKFADVFSSHFRVYITIGIIVIFAVTVVVSKIILERTVLATKTVNVTKPHAQIHTEMS